MQVLQDLGLRDIGRISWASVRNFLDDQPFQLAAALSYYTLLSIAPLLLVVTGIAGLILSDAQISRELIEQARALVGEEGATLLETVTQNIEERDDSILSMVIGSILTLLGASTVFAQLQKALNSIWGVEPQPKNAIVGFLRARLISMTVVLGLGFMLLVSLVLSAALTGLYGYLESLFPGAGLLTRTLNILLTFAIIATLLGLLFRYVPDAHVTWQDTVVGAIATALLFTLGKYLIGLYLGQASVGSAYGAAGSAVVFMVWVYYASLILFFGVEITKAVADHRGHPIIPAEYAEAVEEV